MTDRNLAEVGARLEKAVSNFPAEADPLQRYLLYEQMATAILDSEHADYPAGELLAYLLGYLAAKRYELGIKHADLQ